MRNVSGVFALFAVIIMVLAGCGWGMNIVKFIGMLDGELTAMFVARGVGIFAAPLGAILGWF